MLALGTRVKIKIEDSVVVEYEVDEYDEHDVCRPIRATVLSKECPEEWEIIWLDARGQYAGDSAETIEIGGNKVKLPRYMDAFQ